jgi:hypothetical protein
MRRNEGHARHDAGALFLAVCALLFSGCGPDRPIDQGQLQGRQPRLFPYAVGTVIPPNIAPLNFVVREKGERFFVTIAARGEPGIEIASASPTIAIPMDKWKRLLAGARGRPIGIEVCCYADNAWLRYETVWDTVAVDTIDSHVAYRKIPVCKDWAYMGMYQRDIRGFSEELVFHNKGNDACFNCHSFRGNDAGAMALEVRSKDFGTPMLVGRLINGKPELRAVNTKTAFSSGKAGFSSWHPYKDLIAFSMNRFEMLFYSAGEEPRAVFDAAGDLAVYDIAKNTVSSTPDLCRKERIETMPEWSRDGRFLYFCSAPQVPENQYREQRCDLMRIAFDPESGKWGRLDTVLSAQEARGSVCGPRCSPDGRLLLVNIADHGDFPIDKVGTRLGLVDVKTSSLTVIAPGTRWTDGWHGWSHNGRWIVFNSKRLNGRFSSIWFSYVDSLGVAHAPFVLPQKDASFYESSVFAYNVPEFLTSRIPYTVRQFRGALDAFRNRPKTDAVAAASVPAGGEF